MHRIAAFTIALGPASLQQARLLRATFKASHPDIPFLLIDGAVYARLTLQPGAAHAGEIMTMRAVIGRYLSRHVARLIYLDADILILAPLLRLVDDSGDRNEREPVLLTGDIAESAARSSLPAINAGVLASTSPRFWWLWTQIIESHLLPLVGNFFDQFALRVLAQSKALPCTLLPEPIEGDFYNIAVFNAPGDWRRDGEWLMKGDARVRLWHWAGYGVKPGLSALPPPAQPLALKRIEDGHRLEAATRAADAALFEALFAEEALLPFFQERTAELASMGTTLLEGEIPVTFNGFDQKPIRPPEDLWGTDVPAVWDTLRPVPEGFHRRLLPNAPRYLYARSEERLHESDVERYDKALWAEG